MRGKKYGRAPRPFEDPSHQRELKQVFDLLWCFVPFYALRVAIRSGLLAELSDSHGLTSRQIARRWDWQLHPTIALLSLLSHPGIDILARRGQRWVASAFGRRWFVTGTGSVVHFVERAAALAEAYRGLESTLRTGRPNRSLQKETRNAFGERAVTTRKFHAALDRLSGPVFRDFLSRVQVKTPKTVLDVGGGSGLFCNLLGDKWPAANFTILELPGVARTIKRNVLKDRLTIVPGDWNNPSIRKQFGLVILAHSLHEEPLGRAIQLLKWASWRVAKGGQLLVIGFSASPNIGDELLSNVLGLNVRLELGADNMSLESIPSTVRAAGIRFLKSGNLAGGQTYWLGGRPK